MKRWRQAWAEMPAELCPEGFTGADAWTIDAITDAPKTPEDATALSEVRALLRAHLDAVPWRESYIIRAHYGLDAGPPQTQQQIAGMFGICHGRVSQLELQGLRRLRQHMRRHRVEFVP